MSIEAMKQALEALEYTTNLSRFLLNDEANIGPMLKADEAITSIRQAIARAEGTLEAEKQEQGEPFGIWHQGPTYEESDFYLYAESGDVSCPDCIKLYTTPQQRKPLTDEQIETIRQQPQHHKGEFDYEFNELSFARAIEAAHGIGKGEA
jgi:hypothetical protein